MDEAVLKGIISNILYFLLGGLGAILLRWVVNFLTKKRLWKLLKPDDLVIIAAKSSEERVTKKDELTGIEKLIYIRPSTGLGELRAMGAIATSLTAAYKNTQLSEIVISGREAGKLVEKDLILLGGPKKNEVSKKLLEKLLYLLPVPVVQLEKTGVLHWLVEGEAATFSVESVEPEEGSRSGDNIVEEDYGLIICMQNPFSQYRTRICLFAGCHTYGTVAAAIYFTGRQSVIEQWKKYFYRTYIAIVHCEVQDDQPVNVRLSKNSRAGAECIWTSNKPKAKWHLP